MLSLFRKQAHPSYADLIDELDLNFEKEFKKIDELQGVIYPLKNDIFNAFKYTSLGDCRVVILGQDPYHGCNKDGIPQANGLAFSVNEGFKIPSSLRNIFKTISDEKRSNGNLKHWAEQGVLLLNCSLTVEKGKPNSHAKLWRNITDHIIEHITREKKDLIFLLWGNNSLKKLNLIYNTKHIYISSHPSGLSFKRKLKKYPSFENNNHFQIINNILKNKINW